MNIKIIAVVITLIIGAAGGYIYSNQKPEQPELTPTGFGMQPVVQPGTINSSDAKSFSSNDLNRLKRHKD